MLSLGITQLNNIITEEERTIIKNRIIQEYENNKLNYEGINVQHYKNSFGREIKFENIFNRLTHVIKNITNLDIEESNSYSRIYFNDSVLNSHVDREGLDLTLSIQIENSFNKDIPIYGKGYDGTIYESLLKDKDAVLIKGGELEHWRNKIEGEGSLICVFFHWKIKGLQYQEINNFISDEYCKNIVQQNTDFVSSAVLKDYNDSKIDDNVRSSKSCNYYDDNLNLLVKPLINNLKLETWQLLKYEENNQFLPHYDNGGHLNKRLFTIIIYLNDDYEGGTTSFPNANIIIKPKTGKLIIWKNLNKKITDTKTLHSGDKILKGTKYILVNWANYE